MKGQSLGSVSYVSKTEKYQACFYDSLIKKPLHLGFFKYREDAENKVRDFVFEYYYKNSILLPKGIYVDEKGKCFVYGVKIKGNNNQVFRSKILKEVIEARVNFISNLY
jgi:hypothetical protein